MNIDKNEPIIKYAEKGKPFNYEKLFLNTVADYIFEYKGTIYEKLTDKDKSISLARIIKKMEVNGVPVQDFFRADIDAWNEKGDSFQTVLNLVNLMAQDIFCCFDKNVRTEQGFKKVNRLYAINNEGTLDYYIYVDSDKKGLFSKKKDPSPIALYFADLKDRCEKGLLPRTKN